eukprot:SAG22_NODE_16_length_32723_cov_26.404825_42_plen_60_part_00
MTRRSCGVAPPRRAAGGAVAARHRAIAGADELQYTYGRILKFKTFLDNRYNCSKATPLE